LCICFRVKEITALVAMALRRARAVGSDKDNGGNSNDWGHRQQSTKQGSKRMDGGGDGD
jgi:hypothetical protein